MELVLGEFEIRSTVFIRSLFKKKKAELKCCLLAFYGAQIFVDNMHYFQTNSSVREINTRYKNQLHIPSVRLSAVRRGTAYSAIKILNKLPPRMSGLNKIR